MNAVTRPTTPRSLPAGSSTLERDDLRGVIDALTQDRIAADARLGAVEAERATLMLAKMDLLAELEKARAELAAEKQLRAELSEALNDATEKLARGEKRYANLRTKAERGWRTAEERGRALLALAQRLAYLEEKAFRDEIDNPFNVAEAAP